MAAWRDLQQGTSPSRVVRPRLLGLSNLKHMAKMFSAEPTILVIMRRQDDLVHSISKFQHTRLRKPANVLKRYTHQF